MPQFLWICVRKNLKTASDNYTPLDTDCLFSRQVYQDSVDRGHITSNDFLKYQTYHSVSVSFPDQFIYFRAQNNTIFWYGTDADTQTEEGRTENNPFPGSGRNREVLPFGWGKPLHDGRGRNERDWALPLCGWEAGGCEWADLGDRGIPLADGTQGDSGVSLRDSIKEGKVGGRMRKRNHVVPVRLNAKELRHLDGQVAKSGLSREEFLRSLILGAQLQTKPCEHHAELLRKIAGLCNNANQLAHVANGTGMAGEASVQEMLRISKETWRLVKEEW